MASMFESAKAMIVREIAARKFDFVDVESIKVVGRYGWNGENRIYALESDVKCGRKGEIRRKKVFATFDPSAVECRMTFKMFDAEKQHDLIRNIEVQIADNFN